MRFRRKLKLPGARPRVTSAHKVAEPERALVSSRTGGFVVPSSHVLPEQDDDTVLDASVYTGGRPQHAIEDDSTLGDTVYTGGEEARDTLTVACHSQATTVKAGGKGIYVDEDIESRIKKFKMSVRKHWGDKQARDDARRPTRPMKEISTVTPTKSPRCIRLLHEGSLCNSSESVDSPRKGESAYKPPVASPTSIISGTGEVARKTFPIIEEEEEEEEEEEGGDEMVTPTKSEDATNQSCSFSFQEGTDYSLAFSFQHGVCGTGYEVDERESSDFRDDPTVETPVSLETEDDSRTYGSSSLQSTKVNITDEILMERSSSPGALRLTEEGLKTHEKKALQQSLAHKPEKDFDLWRKRRDEQKWLREKHKEKEDKLIDRSLRIRQTLKATEGPGRSPTRSTTRATPTRSPSRASSTRSPSVASQGKRGFVTAIKSSFKKEDISDVSLAPLNTCNTIVGQSLVVDKKRNLFSRLLRSRDPSIAAKELLERERAATRESRRRKKFMELQERERINQKRKAYLEFQRAREAEPMRRRSSPEFSRSSGSFDHSDASRTRSMSQDISTLSSRSTLPPCTICGKGERTHIASPCMHFAFCEFCVFQMERQKERKCPVCNTDGVTFACVSV